MNATLFIELLCYSTCITTQHLVATVFNSCANGQIIVISPPALAEAAMRLSHVVLLALVAVVAADSSNYYQNEYSEEGVELAQPDAPSNDFYKRRRSSQKQPGLTG